MLIASPEDRVLLWRSTLDSGPSERATLLQRLGRAVQDAIGGALSLYGGYDDLFEETIALLDVSGLLGRDTFRFAFEGADDDETGPVQMVIVLGLLLRESADVERLDVQTRERCEARSSQWSQIIHEHITARLAENPPTLDDDLGSAWCTVAVVAAQFSVTPQAVYRWIDKDKIEYEQTPGGAYRIPIAQFEAGIAEQLAVVAQGTPRTPSARLQSLISAAREEVVDDRERVDPSDPGATYRTTGTQRHVRQPK